MKWLILILGLILVIYEIVTLILQIVKKRKKKKEISNGEATENANTEDDK